MPVAYQRPRNPPISHRKLVLVGTMPVVRQLARFGVIDRSVGGPPPRGPPAGAGRIGAIEAAFGTQVSLLVRPCPAPGRDIPAVIGRSTRAFFARFTAGQGDPSSTASCSVYPCRGHRGRQGLTARPARSVEVTGLEAGVCSGI